MPASKGPRNTALAKRWRQQLKRTKPVCHICGQPIDFEAGRDDPNSFVIDHVIPIHKGGADSLENIAAAHRECNSKKRARITAPIVRRSGTLQ